jgi:hypothetical protein
MYRRSRTLEGEFAAVVDAELEAEEEEHVVAVQVETTGMKCLLVDRLRWVPVWVCARSSLASRTDFANLCPPNTYSKPRVSKECGVHCSGYVGRRFHPYRTTSRGTKTDVYGTGGRILGQ